MTGRRIHTAQSCAEEAKKYATRGEYSKSNGGSYQAATKLGILDSICYHMPRHASPKQKNPRIHTFESCVAQAKKCKTRKEYYENHQSSYTSAKNNGWLDIVCAHFSDNAAAKPVIVFGIEFDSIVYANKHHGLPISGTQAREIARKTGCSPAQAVEIMVKRREGREVEKQNRLLKKEQDKILEPQRKEAARIKAEQAFSRKHFVPIKFCVVCNKCFSNEYRSHFYSTCGDKCAEKNRLISAAKDRKARREKGLDDKGRASKRHKRYGTDYVPGITAAKVAKRDGMKCQICETKVEKHLGLGWQPKGWSIGHIIPVSAGGTTTWDNVQCECMHCNQYKGAMIIENKVLRYRLFG